MISNLRISVAELVVWALLAAAGLTWISFRVVDGAVWLMDWLRDRVTPLLEDELDDGDHAWCGRDDLLELPPERTWEQMTSHQYPLAADYDQRCYRLCRYDPLHSKARCGPCHLIWPGDLTAERERRPPAYEAEHRAHYAAMGFDYPSGLMARVRELAP